MNPAQENSAEKKWEALECCGPLIFDTRHNKVINGMSDSVVFSQKEFDALLFLGQRVGQYQTFEQIYTAVWGAEGGTEARAAAKRELGWAANRLNDLGCGYAWIAYDSGDAYVFCSNYGQTFNSKLYDETVRKYGV